MNKRFGSAGSVFRKYPNDCSFPVLLINLLDIEHENWGRREWLNCTFSFLFLELLHAKPIVKKSKFKWINKKDTDKINFFNNHKHFTIFFYFLRISLIFMAFMKKTNVWFSTTSLVSGDLRFKIPSLIRKPKKF